MFLICRDGVEPFHCKKIFDVLVKSWVFHPEFVVHSCECDWCFFAEFENVVGDEVLTSSSLSDACRFCWQYTSGIRIVVLNLYGLVFQ